MKTYPPRHTPEELEQLAEEDRREAIASVRMLATVLCAGIIALAIAVGFVLWKWG